MSQSYTLTDLQNAAAHAAGRATFATGNSPSACANLAINHIANAHPWSWRHVRTTLDLTNGQNYIALPADFSELVYVRGGTNTLRAVIPTTLDKIFIMREQQASNLSTKMTWVALGAAAQASLGALSTYRLEIYPTPSADESQAMQFQYLRQVAPLSTGTAVADLPWQLQTTLFLLTRAYAELTERNVQGLNWDLATRQIEDAKVRDAMAQPVIGTLKGTVQEMVTDRDWDNRFATDTPVTV